jgi:hypothetical protein
MSKLENKPLTILLSSFLLEKLSKTTRKQVFMLFFSFWGHLGTPKKVPKCPKLGGRYGPMSKLKNNPLTKLLGSFFREKLSKTTKKQFLCCFFLHLGGHFGHPQLDRKRYRKVRKWVGRMAQCLRLKISP